MTLESNPDPATPVTVSPVTPPRTPRAATARLALAAALLSAALASGGTAALILATAPAPAPAATSPIVTVASTSPSAGPGGTAVTRLDSSDAVAAVAATTGPSVVTIAIARGGSGAAVGGSGIIVSADGLILTTAVAAPDNTSYDVLFADQHQATARVVASDAAHGLVLLRADATGLTPARIGTGAPLVVGQLVIAVGSPLGEFTDTVTAGIVSSLGRSIDLRDPSTGRRVALQGLVQTDAAVNAGSSGGPLLDATGTVVGVVVTSAADGRGIGFAIPIADALALLAGAQA